MQVSPIL